jgi:hypothetical protein
MMDAWSAFCQAPQSTETSEPAGSGHQPEALQL